MATPLKINNVGGTEIKQFTTAEENYIAYQIGLHLAASGPNGTGSITTNASHTNIGSYTDTFYNEPVGTHPSTSITSGSTTTNVYQNQGTAPETDSDVLSPIMWVDSASQTGFKEMPNADLNEAVDRYLSTIFTNDYPGSFKLGSSSPGPDYSVWLSSVFTDTRTDGTSVAYNIYRRDTYTPPSTVRPLYARDNAGFDGIQAMTDRQIKYSFGQRAKTRIGASKIGTYQIRTATAGAPTDPGTWVSAGTATDTIQSTADQSFTSTFTRPYTNTYTRGYTKVYTGTYTKTYDRAYTNAYSNVAFTSAYSKTFTRLASESFNRPYTRQQAEAFNRPYTRVQAETYTGTYTRQQAEAFNRPYTRQQAESYAGTYTRVQAEAFNRPYTRVQAEAFNRPYTRVQAESFNRPYTRAFNLAYARVFSSTYVRAFLQGYIANYAGNYAGNFVGNYNRASNYTRSVTTLYTGPRFYSGALFQAFYLSVQDIQQFNNPFRQSYQWDGDRYSGKGTFFSGSLRAAGSYVFRQFNGPPNPQYTATAEVSFATHTYTTLLGPASGTGVQGGNINELQYIKQGIYQVNFNSYGSTWDQTGLPGHGGYSGPARFLGGDDRQAGLRNYEGPANVLYTQRIYTNDAIQVVYFPIANVSNKEITGAFIGPKTTAATDAMSFVFWPWTYNSSNHWEYYARGVAVFQPATFYLGASGVGFGLAIFTSTTPFAGTTNATYVGNINYAGNYARNYVGDYEGGAFTAYYDRNFVNFRTINYTRTYVGDYTNTYTGAYTSNYVNTYTGAYQSNYVNTYTGAYTSNFETNFVGNYTSNYINTYTGLYTSNFETNFVGNYTSNYINTYTGLYTSNYINTYTGIYTSVYTGTYNTAYTPNYLKAYTDEYSTIYTELYTNLYESGYITDYITNYIGNFEGLTIQSGSETDETYTLYVRIS